MSKLGDRRWKRVIREADDVLYNWWRNAQRHFPDAMPNVPHHLRAGFLRAPAWMRWLGRISRRRDGGMPRTKCSAALVSTVREFEARGLPVLPHARIRKKFNEL